MTTEQLSEYMRGIRWKTAGYVAFTGASLLIAGCGMYYGLKSDIRESTYVSTLHYISLDRKIDSLHYIDREEIQSVKNDIQSVKQDMSSIKTRIK